MFRFINNNNKNNSNAFNMGLFLLLKKSKLAQLNIQHSIEIQESVLF